MHTMRPSKCLLSRFTYISHGHEDQVWHDFLVMLSADEPHDHGVVEEHEFSSFPALPAWQDVA